MNSSTLFQKIGLNAIDAADTKMGQLGQGSEVESLALNKLGCEKSIRPVFSPPNSETLRCWIASIADR